MFALRDIHPLCTSSGWLPPNPEPQWKCLVHNFGQCLQASHGRPGFLWLWHEVTPHRRLLPVPPSLPASCGCQGKRHGDHGIGRRLGGTSGCDGARDMILNNQTPWQPGNNAVDSASQTVWGAGERGQWACCWVEGKHSEVLQHQRLVRDQAAFLYLQRNNWRLMCWRHFKNRVQTGNWDSRRICRLLSNQLTKKEKVAN